MSGRTHRFLGLTNTLEGGGGKGNAPLDSETDGLPLSQRDFLHKYAYYIIYSNDIVT